MNKATKQQPLSTARADASAEDYANNMFKDGKGRAEAGSRQQAEQYDRAAHTTGNSPLADEAVEAESYGDTMVERAQSPAGTEASGILDADGGSLGGTVEELDSLEAGNTPVDKNPRMKN